MENRQKFRAFILPTIAISLLILNYSRLSGIENIRAIHVASLIGIGMGIGVLLKNIIAFFKRKL